MTLIQSSTDQHGVMTIVLDSPRNRNALSADLVQEFRDALRASRSGKPPRLLVLSHTGSTFCSGADLSAGGSTPDVRKRQVTELAMLLQDLWMWPTPVVGRIGGHVRAGGNGLVACCDIAIASNDATFAVNEVRVGVVPAVVAPVVVRKIGIAAASRLFLTGSAFSASEAARIHLVASAVGRGVLDEAVRDTISSLLAGAPSALTEAKRVLRILGAGEPSAELRQMVELSVARFESQEGVEGVSAFREHRHPSWLPVEYASVASLSRRSK